MTDIEFQDFKNLYKKCIAKPFYYLVIDTTLAKISALSSGKIDKYEYLTGEEISPPDQSRITDMAGQM